MATLAAYVRRPEPEAPRPRPAPGRQTNPYLLRNLPNEDVYFFSKKIDNSRVVRQADPNTRGRCWSAIFATSTVVVFFLSVLAPSVANVLTGYQIESLRQEERRLLDERGRLEVEEARLASSERLEELARQRNFVPPKPGQVVRLSPGADGALALNLKSR